MNPVYNPGFNYDFNKNPGGDRFFLAAPFLLGALTGGALIAIARPRYGYGYGYPVYQYPTYPNYPSPYYYNNYYNYY